MSRIICWLVKRGMFGTLENIIVVSGDKGIMERILFKDSWVLLDKKEFNRLSKKVGRLL